MEDVARENDPEGESPDEDERRHAVVARAATVAGEPADAEREGKRMAANPIERGREREAVGEDEPREGGGRGGVGVEREPAQDDPRSEQAGAGREEAGSRGRRAGRTRSGTVRTSL